MEGKEKLLEALTQAMFRWERGCPARIQHFIKVHAFARLLAAEEGLTPETRFILEAAALTHDIGIKPSLAKYGSSAGPYQEKEGPGPARGMLGRLGFPAAVTERVCRLIGRHHTYTDIDGADCPILIEADFLVNLYEDGASPAAVAAAREKIFRTAAGRRILDEMYPAEA